MAIISAVSVANANSLGIVRNVTYKCRKAVLEIDQNAAFSSIGRKSNLEMTRDCAEITYQHVLKYIGRTAADGDRLAAIELGGNLIVDIVERDCFAEKEFVIYSLPRERPRIDVKYITRVYRSDGKPGSSGTLVEVKVDRFV